MTTSAAVSSFDDRSAVFAGADVCHEAGLALPDGANRPRFEDDIWDFTHVIGLPAQMARCTRRFDFATITDARWRLVAKELVLAMLTPRHASVIPLPRAYRTALHLNTCAGRLGELTRFFAWPEGQGALGLEQLDTRLCEAYLAHRRYVLDEHRTVVGEQSHGTRRSAAQIVLDLVNYREMFTADRVSVDLRPWGGAAASAVAEMPCGRTQNKTPPVEDAVLQSMLAAALYLVSTLGPHAVELAEEVREADRISSCRAAGLRPAGPAPVTEFTSRACWPSTSERAHRCPCWPTTTSPIASPPAGILMISCCQWPRAFWPGRPGPASSGHDGSRPCADHWRQPSQ
ncbi:hypothetical protein AB0H45_35025 [Streptomyces atroolivaceus]|uniref:hypothetical protein n=1 Tax=Streptomyces atroolivaceus TaxID=66869 RepID=UPI0033CE4A8D